MYKRFFHGESQATQFPISIQLRQLYFYYSLVNLRDSTQAVNRVGTNLDSEVVAKHNVSGRQINTTCNTQA